MKNKKIKILYEGMSRTLGGIEVYIYNLCKRADKDKFEVSILIHKNTKIPFLEELIKEGVKIYEITPRRKNYFKYLEDLKKIYKNNDFDYIHISLMSYSMFERIVLANKYSKGKIILHSHIGSNDYLKSRGFKGVILDKIGQFMTRKIPYFKVACGIQAGQFMFKGKGFTVFNNGIDLEKFKFNEKNRKEIRNELNIKDNEIVIGLIARIDIQKNPFFLLNVFKEYNKLNSNAKLVLVGDGALMNEMNGKIKELSLSDNVLLLGRRNDAYKIYSAFDLFVMPSFAEGFSISLVEAQTNGLKCFTTTNVDRTSNISGNVEFLSLEEGEKNWAKYIYDSDISRDKNILEKIPKKFDEKESYNKVFEFYENNM